MIANLKTLHPYLYKRVRLKALVFTGLGLAFYLNTYLDQIGITAGASQSSAIVNAVGMNVLGAIFLLIGLSIAGVLRFAPDNWKLMRICLWVAFVYALLWLFILIFAVVFDQPRASSVLVLWAYMTYNLFIISSDSGWGGAELVKQIRERGNARD